MIHGLIVGVLLTAQLNTLTYVGSLTDSLRAPARVAVAPDGTVLVTDPVNNRIARYDADDNFLGTWDVPEGPLGVAAHADGRYFVSLRDLGKVGIYDAGFSFVSYLGDGDPLVNFVQPTDIEIAADTGYIYVVDGEGDKLYGFAPDGSVALVVGLRGGGSGEFRYPSAVTVDEGNNRLLVADHDNFRVQAFTLGGVFDLHFGYRLKFPDDGGSEGWLPRTQGLAADADGNVYIADALMGTVRVFDETGVELAKALEYGTDPGDLRTPCDLALSNGGDRLYVVNTNNSAVEIYETPGGGWGGGLSDPWKDPQIGGDSGTNWSAYDAQRMNQRFRPNKRRMRPGGGGGLQDPGGNSDGGRSSYDGPHMIDSPIICGRCHGFPDLPGGHEGLAEGQANLCMSCHSSGGQGLHEPKHELDPADPYGTNPNAADFLGVSHAWGVAAVNADADSVGPPPGSPMELYLDEGDIKCSTCHNQHNTYYSPYLRMRNDWDQMCKACHAARNEGPGELGTHAVGFDYPGGVGEFPPDGDLAPLLLKNDKVECMTCHGVHNTDSGGANDGAGDGMLLRAANDETLCTTCHSEHTGHTPSGDWQPTCIECHDVHDPDNVNLTLVGTSVHNRTLDEDKPVVFTAREGANSFDDGDPAANDGICQVCHTATAYHTHDGSGASHNDGATCTDCHPHDAGFMPTGGSCLGCHGSPQDNGDGVPPGGRRAVADEFALASHHLTGDPVNEDDCIVCHDMSQHQQGSVRLKSADDADTTYVLTGDPFTDSTEAQKAEPFCLACHDDDGAGGQAPFSDSIMPMPIDGSLWTNASHKLGGGSGPMTCLGDGEVFGCHATGHGSAKRKLLAPADASQPPVDGDPLREEEGMCYTCHDADGPASSDIEGQFQLAHHHNVSSLDQGDGSRVECTNCHNPHAASAGSLLADPDSDDPWTGSGEGFCLTCHDGDPPADVSFPASSSGTGYDKSTYIGSAHEAHPGTDSCRNCHEQHGSPYLSILKGEYVIADYNTYSPGDGDYAVCWTCHDEDVIIQQDNAFADLHKKHVQNTRAPCIICHEVHAPYDDGEPGLINFEFGVNNGYDIQYIDGYDASSSFWINGDETQGYCYIRCHNKPHRPKDYDRFELGCTACHSGARDNGDGVPQGGRRAVAGEFPIDNAHAHYGAELNDEACLVCHSLATHMDGYVDLVDPDDGSAYRFVLADELVSDPDLSNFCANCHDADGAQRLAAPLDPFGNGNTPPDVATKFQGTLQWSEWYGDYCFGEEGTLRAVNSHHDISDADQAFSGAKLECLNCHGAHNAAASQPTADPWDTTLPWAGTGNEFCLVCHYGGNGPADPNFSPGVVGPTIALRGLDTCDYTGEPWYVDYTWTHSAHGPDSKRGWTGYSGAPSYDLPCMDCHDPHGSYSGTNTLGNPYMIRDYVDGTDYVDDGNRPNGFNGPPWDTFGTARDVVVTINGIAVDWGSDSSLCKVCHATWLDAYDWHSYCDGCQTCHGHGQAWGESDIYDWDDGTPCPPPPPGPDGGRPPAHDGDAIRALHQP